MNTSLSLDTNKTYVKYKCVVKQWEKDFVKENGRVPSKYDIKEATHEVRYAYKYYFNMKSEVLESSLMDIDITGDMDESNFTFSEFDVTNALELNSDNLNDTEDNVFHAIPTADQIGELMSSKDDSKKSKASGVWGDHLNYKKAEPRKSKITSKVFQANHVSSELFKGCTFNKRNPRKSLSQSFRKSISKCEDKPITNEPPEVPIPIIIDDKINNEVRNNIHINKSKDFNISSVNSVQSVMMNNSPTVRQINLGWLSRCSDMPIQTSLESPMTEHAMENGDDAKVVKPQSYGLKNLSVCPILPSVDESRLSDFVENSESEAELTQSKPNTYRKIRPVVKRCKIEKPEIAQVSSKEHPLTSIEEESPVGNLDGSLDESTDRKRGPNKKKFPAKAEKLAQGISKEPSTQGGRKRIARVKKVPQKLILTSDSECEQDNLKRKRVTTRATRGKLTKNVKHKIVEEETTMDHSEFENFFMADNENIAFPRFPIKSSILKESNLVDGLAAALQIPRDVKQIDKTRSKMTNLNQEEKLKKKIEDGSLNENFVKINLEKKVYARGKKTMNFSKFKKQQWKDKKKMLHNTPEFPEGGILKCFKCGQPGHMSRFCKAGRGTDLLALDEYDNEEKSPYISLQDAESLKCPENTPTVSENIMYQSIDQTDFNQDNTPNSSQNAESSGSLSLKGIHQIPDSFIKLLATPSGNIKVPQPKIEALYPLAADGTLNSPPQEVMKALRKFGHTDFRSGQEIAVMRILSGLSTLVTLSTGSGKSLCYQLPAYLYAKHNKCITLVISPLVSLMEDQVTSMPDFVNAACLHTNQSPTTREKIIELIKAGDIHILLISPEAIVAGEKSTGFGAILRQLPPIAFACIDEVHCVSQWSHNFRPSYLMICRVLREKMGVQCVLGLTATATKPTISEIVQHLEITDGIAGVITNKPLPDNLVLTVSRDAQRDHYLLELLESERFLQCNSIIVYCIRRDECERVASLIRSSMQGSKPTLLLESQSTGSKKRKRFSWIVEAYHAGMSAAKRRKTQQAFMSGELRIVVATVAFGMGINKSDIRGVIHYNMPGSFESYVQEVGRAGRDGLPAQCHVFIDKDCKDKDELLRHIHANSIERHVIRRMLQKVFLPCGCSKMLKNMPGADGDGNTAKCQGHEVAFSVDETVSELDIPSENIATLLCYLELHPKKFAKVLSNVYTNCKIISYGGVAALLKAAEKCPPLAMALALQKKRGKELDKSGILEFCVIEVAAAIGWESGVVKYQLKNLEWHKPNGFPKKTLLRVEFNTLGFRVKSPGDLSSSELDAALDSLYERTQLQEKTMLHQLQQVSKALFSVSFASIFQCSTQKDEETYLEKSNSLKDTIRRYFSSDSPSQTDIELDARPINKELVTQDVRGLLVTYRDCTFTGRAVARILQGISSPNFPAIVWGRCRYWRSHISADFYELVNIGKQQIISMR